MSNKGWIKLHRQVQDCWIWWDEPFTKGQAWIDLLLLANHEDKKICFDGELITIQRGQYLTSVRKLALRWQWSNKKCLKFLRMLEADKMLKKESTARATLLTIENYDVFQDTGNTNDNSLDTSKETLRKQSLPTNKNEKNEKNEKNKKINKEVLPYEDCKTYASSQIENTYLLEKVYSWIDYKQERGEVYTPTGFKSWVTGIQKKVKEFGLDYVTDSMVNSMAHQWQGVTYVEKDRPQKPTQHVITPEEEAYNNKKGW